MLPYQKLLFNMNIHHKNIISVRKGYFVIKFNNLYHITIYQDQWDDYFMQTKLPYYLFHISSNNIENRCSSYFWVDRDTNKIKGIDEKYFKYEQPSYSFFGSTRKPCEMKEIKSILSRFQSILDEV